MGRNWLKPLLLGVVAMLCAEQIQNMSFGTAPGLTLCASISVSSLEGQDPAAKRKAIEHVIRFENFATLTFRGKIRQVSR